MILFNREKLKHWFSPSNDVASEYIEILESLEKNILPIEINFPDNKQAPLIRELVEGEFLSGNIEDWYDGYQIMNLRFNPKGRIFFESLKTDKKKQSLLYRLKEKMLLIATYIVTYIAGLFSSHLSEYINKLLSSLN